MVSTTKIKIDDQKSLLLDLPKSKIEKAANDSTNFDKSLEFFHVMKHDEPHNIRRNQILKAHPEIKQLFVKEPLTIAFVILLNLFQIFSCWVISHKDYPFYIIIIAAYFISAVVNHALYVLIHDITHFLAAKSVGGNRILSIIANLPAIIPLAISFGRYHRDHHSNFGDILNDPDIPCVGEIKFFNTWYKRLVYVFIMPLMYAVRPLFKTPKQPTALEYINILCCVCYAIAIQHFFGGKALSYLLLGTYFGLSINPVGGHLIAEHYEFVKGQDSYSYYGWINYINFNVGMHIEHHDFPNVPWSKLPLVRKIAPEFYNNLPQMESYADVLFKYVFDGSMGPWSRITLNLGKVWNEESGDYKEDEDLKAKAN